MNTLADKSILSADNIMEMAESLETIILHSLELEELIDKHIEKDNPDREIVVYLIDQIYDLALMTSFHGYALMYSNI